MKFKHGFLLSVTEAKQAYGSHPEFILVEEDILIRSCWAYGASKRGLKLAMYESPEAFLADLELFHFECIFCLDQDFGARKGVGVALAKVIKSQYSAHVCLVTGHRKECFETELLAGTIDQVCDKVPWPFGARTNCQEIFLPFIPSTFPNALSEGAI